MRTAHGACAAPSRRWRWGRAVVDETATQGYLMYAADAATPALLAFTVRHTSGYVRVALTAADCDRLDSAPVRPAAGAPGTAWRIGSPSTPAMWAPASRRPTGPGPSRPRRRHRHRRRLPQARSRGAGAGRAARGSRGLRRRR